MFQRQPRGVSLTAEGAELYENIATGLEYIDNALGAFSQKDKTELRVVCNSSLAVRWLLPKLPDFCEAHPDIGLKLRTALWRTDAISMQTDIGIYLGTNQGSGETIPLTGGQWVAVTSPQNVSNKNQRLALVAGWEAQYASLGFVPSPNQPTLNVDSFHTALGLVEAGVAATVCPRTLAFDALASSELIELTAMKPYQKIPYQCIINGQPNVSAQAFQEWLFDQKRDTQA